MEAENTAASRPHGLASNPRCTTVDAVPAHALHHGMPPVKLKLRLQWMAPSHAGMPWGGRTICEAVVPHFGKPSLHRRAPARMVAAFWIRIALHWILNLRLMSRALAQLMRLGPVSASTTSGAALTPSPALVRPAAQHECSRPPFTGHSVSTRSCQLAPSARPPHNSH